MSGLPDPSDDAMAILERAVREEITSLEARVQILATVKTQVRGEPLPFPAPPPEERAQEPAPARAAGEVYSAEGIEMFGDDDPDRLTTTILAG